MNTWLRPLSVTLLPALAALALSFSPQQPFNLFTISFVLLVFVPYALGSCTYHAYASRHGITDYIAYLVVGLVAGIFCAALIALLYMLKGNTSTAQASNVFMLFCPTALIYSTGLSSFFWAWVVSHKTWPRIISLAGLLLLLAPYRLFVMNYNGGL